MFEDDGDIDDNGIPDSIQRDPVVERTPMVFGETPNEGLPGMPSPVEGTFDPMPQMPVEPTPPPEGADQLALDQYQRDMAKYNRMFEMYSKIMSETYEMKKSIINNLRG